MSSLTRRTPAYGSQPISDWTEWFGYAAGPMLITAAHLAYGATTRLASLVLVVLGAGLLLVLLASRTNRRRLERVPLGLEGAAFGLTIGATLWSMTPLVPGGANPVWVFAGTAGASTLDLSATGLEIIKLMGLASFFLIGAIQGTLPQGRRRSLLVVLALGAGLATLMLAGFLTGPQLGQAGRLTGPFPSANVAGTLLASLFVLSATWFAGRWSAPSPLGASDRWTRIGVPAALALLFAVSLVATGSRGAFVAAAAALAMLVIVALSDPGTTARRRLGAGVIILSTLLALACSGVIVDRLNPAILAQDQRHLIFQTHWNAFIASPLMGYGLGTFGEVNRQLLNAENYAALWAVNAAHNLYLQWIEEAGLIGALPIAVAVFVPIATAARGIFGPSRPNHWSLGLWLALIVFLVHGLSDFSLQVYSVAAMFAFLLGLQRATRS